MRRLTVVLYSIIGCVAGLGANPAEAGNLLAITPAVAFSSLDALGNYSQDTGIRISGASAFPIGYEAYACQFVPVKSGKISSIELGLGYSSWGSSGSQVDVRLSLATGGLPLTTPALAAGTLTTATPFGAGGLTSFIPVTPVQIEIGQAYWLTLTPHSDTTASTWCNPSPSFNLSGVIGYTSPYGPGGLAWYMGNSTSAGIKAFRVNVVPEPSLFALVGLGATFALVMRKRPAPHASHSVAVHPGIPAA